MGIGSYQIINYVVVPRNCSTPTTVEVEVPNSGMSLLGNNLYSTAAYY